MHFVGSKSKQRLTSTLLDACCILSRQGFLEKRILCIDVYIQYLLGFISAL